MRNLPIRNFCKLCFLFLSLFVLRTACCFAKDGDMIIAASDRVKSLARPPRAEDLYQFLVDHDSEITQLESSEKAALMQVFWSAGELTITKPELIDSLQKQRNAFSSIFCEYSLEIERASERGIYACLCALDADGRHRYHRTHMSGDEFVSPGSFDKSFDGKVSRKAAALSNGAEPRGKKGPKAPVGNFVELDTNIFIASRQLDLSWLISFAPADLDMISFLEHESTRMYGGTEKVEGQNCILVSNLVHDVWFSVDSNFAVVRHVRYDCSKRGRYPIDDVCMRDFFKNNGASFPREVTRRVTAFNKAAPGEVSTYTFRVNEIVLNQALPSKLFEKVFWPGTYVYNEINGIPYFPGEEEILDANLGNRMLPASN